MQLDEWPRSCLLNPHAVYRRPFGPQDVTSVGPALPALLWVCSGTPVMLSNLYQSSFCACKISNFQCLRLEKDRLELQQGQESAPGSNRGLGFRGLGFRFRV